MQYSPEKVVHYPFGTAHLFPDYLIMVMNEGITVLPEHNTELLKLSEGYYSGRPFVYISHRKHSYAVDPSVYHQTSKIPNLTGFAVVAEKEIALATASVEQLFIKKPFMTFGQVDDAIAWARLLLGD